MSQEVMGILTESMPQRFNQISERFKILSKTVAILIYNVTQTVYPENYSMVAFFLAAEVQQNVAAFCHKKCKTWQIKWATRKLNHKPYSYLRTSNSTSSAGLFTIAFTSDASLPTSRMPFHSITSSPVTRQTEAYIIRTDKYNKLDLLVTLTHNMQVYEATISGSVKPFVNCLLLQRNSCIPSTISPWRQLRVSPGNIWSTKQPRRPSDLCLPPLTLSPKPLPSGKI